MIYLDYNATTPVHPEVLEAMLPYFTEKFANPASRTHEPGREAARAVEEARVSLASYFSLDPKYVVFTSGATEANNLAILGLRKHLQSIGRTKIVTSMFEHKAVLDPIQHLVDDFGFEAVYVRPKPTGYVDPEDFKAVLDDKVGLVSLMHVNNELGTVQPVEKVAEYAKGVGALMHVDGAQGFAKVKIKLGDNIDYYSASAHKIYGPKGIGALFINGRKSRKVLSPIMFGGGHEQGLRSGTLATPLIVGLDAAFNFTKKKFNRNFKNNLSAKISNLKSSFSNTNIISSFPVDEELPLTFNFRIRGINNEAFLIKYKDYCMSNGSACTSSIYRQSHVLEAIGMTEIESRESIRSSFSQANEVILLSEFLENFR